MNNKAVSFCDKTMEYSLYLLIFCLPFAKAGISIFTALALLAWIGKRVFGFRADGFKGLIPKTPLNKAIAFFIIVNLISVVFSADLQLSVRAFFSKTLKFALIFFMMVETVNTATRVKRVLGAMLASAALIATDAGVQYIRGASLLRGYLLKPGGISASFSLPNVFAAWLITFIPVLSGLSICNGRNVQKKQLNRWLVVLIGLLLGFLILTFSRGAWIGFFVVFCFVGCYFVKDWDLKHKMLILFIAAIVFTSSFFLINTIKMKAMSRDMPKESIYKKIGKKIISFEKFGARKYLWNEVLIIIKEHPFTGCGLNTYSTVAPGYKINIKGGIYPHNSYLHMAAEIGLLGLGVFLWILFSFFKMGFEYISRTKDYLALGLLAGISGFLIHAFFDVHLYAMQMVVLFWFMLGFVTALIKVSQSNSIKDGSIDAPGPA